MARLGFELALEPDRVCAQARHSRSGDEGAAVQHGPQSVPYQLRRRNPRRSVERAAAGDVCLDPADREDAEQARNHRDRLPQGRSGRAERPENVAGQFAGAPQ